MRKHKCADAQFARKTDRVSPVLWLIRAELSAGEMRLLMLHQSERGEIPLSFFVRQQCCSARISILPLALLVRARVTDSRQSYDRNAVSVCRINFSVRPTEHPPLSGEPGKKFFHTG